MCSLIRKALKLHEWKLEARGWKLLPALQSKQTSTAGGDTSLAVLAVQHIRRMRGGAQGQLMLGADGHVYVVKFQNNPQHMRVLANEFLASKLAAAAGLTAPESSWSRFRAG